MDDSKSDELSVKAGQKSMPVKCYRSRRQNEKKKKKTDRIQNTGVEFTF